MLQMGESLHYEKLIESDKIENKDLIKLSELRRKVCLDNRKIDVVEEYYDKFKQVAKKVRYNRIPLIKHPSFEWNGFTSSNWAFERVNIEHLLVQMTLDDAYSTDDVKTKNKYYLQAMKHSHACIQTVLSNLFTDSENRLYKVMNIRYHLSNLFSIAADRFHNAHTYKNNIIAVKKAYQLKELSSIVWKSADSKKILTQYKANALLEIATRMEDDKCGEKVALLQTVIYEDECPENVINQHKLWDDQNNQVYFQPVHTDVELKTITLEEAFHTLQESLVSS